MFYYKPESLVEKYFHLRLALLFNPAIYAMTVGFSFLANRLKLKSLDVVQLLQTHTIQS